jgi:hypothetical protein
MSMDQWVIEVSLNPRDPNTVRNDLWPAVLEAPAGTHIRIKLNGTPGSAALKCQWRRADLNYQFVTDSERTRLDWALTLEVIPKVLGVDFE